MTGKKQLLTLTAAARELGMSRQRLHLLAKEGRLGSQIAGRYWVFTPEEIENYRPLVKASKGGRPPKEDLNLTMEKQTPAVVSA